MFDQETIRLVTGSDSVKEPSWWESYRQTLTDDGLSVTGRQVIETDCEYIVSRCLYPESVDWPSTRYRSGLVMGAVQSGKTASMLGVISKCLDKQVDIVIVLAGTITNLWLQTSERAFSQLKSSEDALFLPLVSPAGRRSLSDYYQLPPKPRLKRMLRNRTPLIFVAMKNGDHLRELARQIKNKYYPLIEETGRDFHMLIIDDEADDGSILDSRVEQNLDPLTANLKQIPRHIVDLWSDRRSSPTTASDRLFVNYLAYTATPQANFLQEEVNPLAPTAYVASLRTAFDQGQIEPRSITYSEPNGFRKFYIGGEIFYSTFANTQSICITSPPTIQEPANHSTDCACRKIQEAVRCFLMAGAIRYLRSGSPTPSSSLRETVYSTYEEAKSATPFPHTMLLHPGSEMTTHFRAADTLLEWGCNVSPEEASNLRLSGVRCFNADAVMQDMTSYTSEWTKWIENFERFKKIVDKRFNSNNELRVFTIHDWEIIREFILETLLPLLNISIINSDENSDARPQFDPQKVNGGWKVAPNFLNIFVSGNVMSRGITLPGLCTTLFMRQANESISDTQMQMQRWFGYRGSSLDVTRLFLGEDQLRRFAEYHEADIFLRQQIIAAMNENSEKPPSPTVLEGMNYIATGKIVGQNKIPLHPGNYPFIRLINDSTDIDQNIQIVAQFFQNDFTEVEVNGRVLGMIKKTPLSLIETASLLSQFRYANYQPDQTLDTSKRWKAIESQFPIETRETHPAFPLFDPPTGDRETSQMHPKSCPYHIAAYLRFWDVATTFRISGFSCTDRPDQFWRNVDLQEKMSKKPNFWLGIKFGDGGLYPKSNPVDDSGFPFDVKLMRTIIESGKTKSSWCPRDHGEMGYLGDQLFDFHFHQLSGLPQALSGLSEARPSGAPGLILLHLIERQNSGPVLSVGLAIPKGGPDHIVSGR